MFGIEELGEGESRMVRCPMPEHPEQTGDTPPVSVRVLGGKVLAYCHVCKVSLPAMLPHLNGGMNGTGSVEGAVEAIQATGKGGVHDYAGYLGVPVALLQQLGVRGTKDTVAFDFPPTDAIKTRHLDKQASQKFTWAGTVAPPLWPLPDATMAATVELTEGESDAITLRHAGFAAYATTKGASGS